MVLLSTEVPSQARNLSVIFQFFFVFTQRAHQMPFIFSEFFPQIMVLLSPLSLLSVVYTFYVFHCPCEEAQTI
jgi:hypothetical protein